MQSPAEVIQLALAPVFLLVAVGQLINAVTSRLARVIDRSRLLADQLHSGESWRPREDIEAEFVALARRVRFANLAINFLTSAAVCVCGVVMLLFVNALVEAELELLLVGLFLVTMGLITGGLITFLVEVTIATTTLQVRGIALPATLASSRRRERDDAR
jgi:hypothetical protein